jgi:hypothetical protein
MSMDITIVGGTSGNRAEVAGTGNNQVKIIPETDATNNPLNIGDIRCFSENDQGLSTGVPFLSSPETSTDYRLRTELDTILDEESFVYTAQNFTKHAMYATTYAPTWTSTGFNTNPANSLTAAAAAVLKTWKTFSVVGTETLSLDIEAAITFQSGVQLPANTVIEFGIGLTSNTTPYDFFDGFYFRINPTACYAVIRNNSSTDTAVSNAFKAVDGVTTWQPVSGRKYEFILYLSTRSVLVWVNDPVLNEVWLASTLKTPSGYGAPIASPAAQVVVRQFQASAPPVASQITIGRYSVRRGGQVIASSLGEFNTRAVENIYSQGTLTTTANQTITTGSVTRPTAAAPTNTTTLLASLSGIVLETGTLAVGTDGILMSFQNPVLPTATSTTYTTQRRLRIDGVRIGSSVQTAFTAGGFTKYFYLAYGSTALSLQGVATDTATTKAYRRIMLELVHAYTATQAIATLPAQIGPNYIQFKNPVFVNPGEFVALCTYHIGTAGVTGVLQHNIAFDYAWE